MSKIKKFIVGQLETNAYVYYSDDSRTCFIIDPAARSLALETFISDEKLKPLAIILTHGHIDHCGGAQALCDKYSIGMQVHEADVPLLSSAINLELKNSLGLDMPPKPESILSHHQIIETGDLKLQVLHTPGHTQGSICLLNQKTLFSGDTLFFGSIGRTDLPGGDFSQIKQSLSFLMEFPEDMQVLPGHGENTTIGQEKRINPFL